MSTYIQVNIYNQTLETLKLRGIDLEAILRTIDCGNCYVSEIPIHPPKKPHQPSPGKVPETTENASPVVPLKIFKSISGENSHGLRTVTLGDVLKLGDKKTSLRGTLNNLFDDWDPLLNLSESAAPPEESPEDPATSSIEPTLSEVLEASMPSESGLKIPKQEIPDDEPEENTTVEMNDSEQANEQEMQIIQDLLKQRSSSLATNFASAGEGSLKSVQIKMESMVKSRRKLFSEDPEISNTIYSIVCNFPGCNHQYNWRVKYGKLRLLDHALTHSDRRIPCKLCGFAATNVRRMRSHYAKNHPTERVQGYGMKALVSDEQDNEEELKELWQKCYAHYIGLIGEAGGFSDGEKFRRIKTKRKIVEDTVDQHVDTVDPHIEPITEILETTRTSESSTDADLTLNSTFSNYR